MLPVMMKNLPRSEKELLEKTEHYLLSVKKLYEEAQKDTLCQELDCILKKKELGWEMHLSELMQRKDHKAVMQTDQRLIALKKVYRETAVLCKITSLDDVWKVYQKTVFYLRRIEMDMPTEDLNGLCDFIGKWNISAEYFIAVLSQGAIYQNLDTGYKLSMLLLANGYSRQAEKIMLWVNEFGKG